MASKDKEKEKETRRKKRHSTGFSASNLLDSFRKSKSGAISFETDNKKKDQKSNLMKVEKTPSTGDIEPKRTNSNNDIFRQLDEMNEQINELNITDLLTMLSEDNNNNDNNNNSTENSYQGMNLSRSHSLKRISIIVPREGENKINYLISRKSEDNSNIQRFEEIINEPWRYNLFKSYLQTQRMSSLLEFYIFTKELNRDIRENRSGYEYTIKSLCLTYMHHEELPSEISNFLRTKVWSEIDKLTPILSSHFHNLEISSYNLLIDNYFANFLAQHKMFNRSESTELPPPELLREEEVEVEKSNNDPFDLPDTAEFIKIKKENGNLIVDAATTHKIIQKLTSPKLHTETGADFQFAALLAHQYYSKTSDFLELLLNRLSFLTSLIELNNEDWKKKTFLPTIIRMISVTKFLFEIHVDHFRSNADDKKVLLNLVTNLRTYMEAPATNLYEFIIKKIAVTGSVDNEFQFDRKPPKPKVSRYLHNTPKQSITFSMLHPIELARQISINDHRLYRAIKPHECLHMNWTKETKTIHSPHVIESIQQFCSLSIWIATQVVIVENLEKRADVLHKIIRMGHECFLQHNFNGAMSEELTKENKTVISGLQFHYIFRLKKTWELLPEKGWDMWEQLQNVFKPDQNFANLRTEIANAPLPSIPYLGMYLSDLTFIDNEPNFLNPEKTIVNFSKMRYIAAILQQIQKFQNSAFCFEEVDVIQQFLRQLPSLTESELYQFSLNCEPRAEKGQTVQTPPEDKKANLKKSRSFGNVKNLITKSS